MGTQYTSSLPAEAEAASSGPVAPATGGRADVAGAAAREARRADLLRALGAAVRARRTECRLTLRALAGAAHVSERFLVQLETGEGNISIARLADVAEALDTTAAQLLASADARPAKLTRLVTLLGLRGAGKSTIGPSLARRLGVPFVELDALVAREAGMGLSTIFEMHGEAYFRRLEREALARLFSAGDPAVVATGGSIVTDPRTYAMLRDTTVTVWLKASARDHWDRVVAQGDVRPMKNRENAMSELKALLRDRKPLYGEAQIVVDTSSVTPEAAVDEIVHALSRPWPRGAARPIATPVSRIGAVPRNDAAVQTRAPKKTKTKTKTTEEV